MCVNVFAEREPVIFSFLSSFAGPSMHVSFSMLLILSILELLEVRHSQLARILILNAFLVAAQVLVYAAVPFAGGNLQSQPLPNQIDLPKLIQLY